MGFGSLINKRVGGWQAVIASSAGLAFGYTTLVVYTFGVFVKPLENEFGWSRTAISTAQAFAAFFAVVLSPYVGNLLDRHGVRKIVLPMVLIVGPLFASYYVLTSSILHFYIVYILLALIGVFSSPLPYTHLVTQWFTERRGLALGLALAGGGIGGVFMPVIAAGFVENFGWRQAYLGLALIAMVGLIPVSILFLNDNPNRRSSAPAAKKDTTRASEGAPARSADLSVGEAFRTAHFWILAGSFLTGGIVFAGLIAHFIPLLSDRGMPIQTASFAIAVYGIGSIVGRVLAGYLLDRFYAPLVAAAAFVGPVIGLLLLSSSSVGWIAIAVAFVLGLAGGSESNVFAYLTSHYFGLRNFGEIYGYQFSAFAIGFGVGPVLMGWGYDSTGSYENMLLFFAGAMVVVCLVLLWLSGLRSLPRQSQPA